MTHESNPNRAPAAPELLHCPFCGACARIETDTTVSRLYCDHAETCFFDAEDMMRGMQSMSGDAETTLAEKWNRRAAPVPAGTLREPVMANGKPLSDYLESAARETLEMDDWTRGYEECKRRLFGQVGEQLRALRSPVAARELDADAERLAFEAEYRAMYGMKPEDSMDDKLPHADTAERWWLKGRAAQATAESAPASAAPKLTPLTHRAMMLDKRFEWRRRGDDGQWESYWWPLFVADENEARTWHADRSESLQWRAASAAPDETAMRLLRAAKVYAFNYMQDEADDEEDCVCGPKQHAEAKEVFEAISEFEKAVAPSNSPVGAKEQDNG